MDLSGRIMYFIKNVGAGDLRINEGPQPPSITIYYGKSIQSIVRLFVSPILEPGLHLSGMLSIVIGCLKRTRIMC